MTRVAQYLVGLVSGFCADFFGLRRRSMHDSALPTPPDCGPWRIWTDRWITKISSSYSAYRELPVLLRLPLPLLFLFIFLIFVCPARGFPAGRCNLFVMVGAVARLRCEPVVVRHALAAGRRLRIQFARRRRVHWMIRHSGGSQSAVPQRVVPLIPKKEVEMATSAKKPAAAAKPAAKKPKCCIIPITVSSYNIKIRFQLCPNAY